VTNKTRDAAARAYRNRVRGILNVAKERGYGVDDAVREQRLRVALRSILLEARLSLPREQYLEHLNWLHGQTRGGDGSLPTAIGQGLLYTNIYAQRADLATELTWIGARLSAAASTIATHLEARRQLSITFLDGASSSVLEVFDNIEKSVGESHWLIALRIAALQRFQGIDAHKSYLATLRKRSRQGVSAAFAYYTSIRNEPSVTLSWFTNDILRRPFAKRYPEIRTYLRFALLGELPGALVEVSDILRVEQAHSDVDLYETTVTVLQAMSRRSLPAAVMDAVRLTLNSMSGAITDPRLIKLHAVYGFESVGSATLPRGDERPLISLIHGETPKKSDIKSEELTDDPALLIWSALALGATDTPDTIDPATPFDDFIVRARKLCERGRGFDEARMLLAKDARNLSGLSIGQFLSSACAALNEPTVLNLASRVASASLSTGTWGTLDRLLHRERAIGTLPTATTCSDEFADCLHDGDCPNNWSATAQGFASLRPAVRTGEFAVAYDFLECLLASPIPLAVNWGRVAALEVFTANQDMGRALDLIGKWAAKSEDNDADLPIALALESIKASHITRYGDRITTPIALNAWRRSADNDTKQTLLRMAFNRFMCASAAEVPSALSLDVLRSAPAEYTYFLEQVCIPGLMDMNPAFTSSQALLKERRAVCALLRSANPARSSIYDEEIVSITQTLSIWEGLKIVDGSRIHVDESAFSRAMHAELEGSFARYASLVKAGIGVAEDFDVVLRSMVRQEGYVESLAIPENEADEILATMVLRMKQMFLSNSIYGLDGYISKRIRHGSLIGHLRGPVERHKLITQRSNDRAAYEVNNFWTQKLSQSDTNAKTRLSKALEDFSKAFDRELLQLKDERLQIRDEKHAEGIFDFPVTAAALVVIRSSIKSDVTLDGLTRAAIVAFWTLLRSALSEAQNLVRVRFQTKVSEMFNRLQAAASPCIRNEPFYGEFINAVRLAAEETQVQTVTVAGWFEKSGVDDHGRTYSLDDAVDIGVKSAQSAFGDFRPYVVKRCDKILMPNASLQLIADVLLVALGNVYAHSGMGNEPQIDIDATMTPDEETVSFRVRSKVDPLVRTSQVEANLATLRKRIDAREFEPYVGSEGNSGLLKLAAVVHQSEYGNLRFEFTDAEEFELEIKLAFILEVAPVSEDDN
jgi:hypothetical protein